MHAVLSSCAVSGCRVSADPILVFFCQIALDYLRPVGMMPINSSHSEPSGHQNGE
jgi:hypothetical protein